MGSPYRFFEVEQINEVTFVTLIRYNPFDEMVLFDLQKELLAYAEATKPDKLVVSFEKIEFTASALIGTLISLKRKLLAINPRSTVALCSLNQHSREVFETIDPKQSLFARYQKASEAYSAL